MKQTETLVEDIYRLMETKDADPSVDVEEEIEKYGENIKALMRTEFGREKRKDNRTLRLSNIGRTDKYPLEPRTRHRERRDTTTDLRQVYVRTYGGGDVTFPYTYGRTQRY